MLKNLVILFPHLNNYGGASKYALEIGERLAKRGWKVIFVTTKVNKEIIKQYSHIDFKTTGGFVTGSIFYWLSYPIFQYRLHRLLNKIDNKILFPQIFPPIWWAIIYKIFHPQTPVVWMCHEPSAFIHSNLVIDSLKQPGKFIAKTLNPLLKFIDKNLVGKIDYLIANSQYGFSEIKRIYQRQPDLIAYPGVDFKLFKPKDKKQNYLFTVSRLDKQKNIDIIIKAFILLPERIKKNYLLEIAGEGVEKDNLVKLVSKLNLSDKVIFSGWIPEKDLPAKYAKAKLVLFAAKNEPFGIVLVEAMACGTPVIAFKSGGVKESVVNGQTGILIEKNNPDFLAEKIIELLDKPDFLAKMGKKARQHVKENFSWNIAAEKIDKFLNEINQNE